MLGQILTQVIVTQISARLSSSHWPQGHVQGKNYAEKTGSTSATSGHKNVVRVQERQNHETNGAREYMQSVCLTLWTDTVYSLKEKPLLNVMRVTSQRQCHWF